MTRSDRLASTARWLCVLAVILLPRFAWAHASLLASAPEDGVRLERSPATIVLRFDEPVQPVLVRVLDRTRQELADPRSARAEGNEVRLALPAQAAIGTFVVSYSVISADSHPVTGAFIYAVGEAPDATARPQAQSGWRAWQVAGMANRALHLTAMALFAGGLLYLLLIGPLEGMNLAALMRWSGVVAGLTALLSVGLQGIAMDDAPLGALMEGGPWQLGAETTRAYARSEEHTSELQSH